VLFYICKSAAGWEACGIEQFTLTDSIVRPQLMQLALYVYSIRFACASWQLSCHSHRCPLDSALSWFHCFHWHSYSLERMWPFSHSSVWYSVVCWIWTCGTTNVSISSPWKQCDFWPRIQLNLLTHQKYRFLTSVYQLMLTACIVLLLTVPPISSSV